MGSPGVAWTADSQSKGGALERDGPHAKTATENIIGKAACHPRIR